MDKIKDFVNAASQAIQEVVADSKAFRAQEKARPKPTPAPKPSTVPTSLVNDDRYATLLSQYECSVLSRHIVKGMVDFPSHINIKPYRESVAVPIEKIGNNQYSVWFDKNDPSQPFTTTLFHNQLQKELNERMERVCILSLQEIDKINMEYSKSIVCLQAKYCDPCSPYFDNVCCYNNDVYSLQMDYNSAIADNSMFLNQIYFYSLVDMGHYVITSFTAGYNGGAVLC